jgi:Fe-S-cluster containining protein
MLTPPEGEALRARVAGGAAQRRALDPAARRRSALPCPLLVDNRCVAYAVRPLTCRGFNSSEARRCEAALGRGDPAAVPMYAPQQRLHTFVLDGLRAGLQESGLDGALLELTAALEIAVQAPDVEARWLAGEAVFAPMRLP